MQPVTAIPYVCSSTSDADDAALSPHAPGGVRTSMGASRLWDGVLCRHYGPANAASGSIRGREGGAGFSGRGGDRRGCGRGQYRLPARPARWPAGGRGGCPRARRRHLGTDIRPDPPALFQWAHGAHGTAGLPLHPELGCRGRLRRPRLRGPRLHAHRHRRPDRRPAPQCRTGPKPRRGHPLRRPRGDRGDRAAGQRRGFSQEAPTNPTVATSTSPGWS